MIAAHKIPNINLRPKGAQLVRDVSNDYTLLNYLTRHGWRVTEIDDRAGWYWATRKCKSLKN
ncbi:hypothetical protein [Deefgea rivuli]|uniref:hypothetical protein n=1 Tax=Deefgea rivuli TaxID=400948 RepID=UPI000480C58C|nr:hypothetical protein [Deefgea rivuli]